MENSKPRILIAAGIYPPDPGGPAIHAQAQYEWFKLQGVETRISIFSHYRSKPFLVRHFLYFLDLLIKVPRVDVVYAHDALGVGWPAYLAARIWRKKIAVRVGGDIAWERAADHASTQLSFREWYERGEYKRDKLYKLTHTILKRFDALVVPTKLLSDIYSNYYSVPAENLHVIANPVPERESKSSVSADIIYASRLVAYKNLDFVIRNLSDMLPELGHTRLVIMGDGPEKAKLEALSKNLNLGERVIFKGRVSQNEVIKATRQCRFAIAPALTEFNPNYILQCISYGKPFLISRENGLPLDVPDMFLFDARSSQEFKTKMRSLLSESGYARAIKAMNNLGPAVTWEDNLNDNLRLLESLLKA